jgi:hypothetical protein
MNCSCYQPSPLMTAALAALENEARENPDAARLLTIIEDMHYYQRGWGLLNCSIITSVRG